MFYALAFISTLLVMFLLKTIVEIFPSILACMFRWKESINIESSVRLSRDRDFTAIAMLIPFCLTAFSFRIYNPRFISNLPDNPRLWAVIGIFAAYVLLRKTISFLIHPRKVPQKTLTAADKSANTFFILLALTLLAVGSICNFFDASLNSIRVASLWLSALIYGLYLIRKLQIFTSSCSLFAGFLYLCALEILPTGILIASGMIF